LYTKDGHITYDEICFRCLDIRTF